MVIIAFQGSGDRARQETDLSLYDLDKLIGETRRIAAEYRRSTGQTLPVTPEIARHDAIRLLGLEAVDANAGFDAQGTGDAVHQRYLVKGRVIFDEQKSGQRIGQLNLDAGWNMLALVLLDESYEPTEIYTMSRDELAEAGVDAGNKRGAMTIAKFRAVGRLVWDRWNGNAPNGKLEEAGS